MRFLFVTIQEQGIRQGPFGQVVFDILEGTSINTMMFSKKNPMRSCWVYFLNHIANMGPAPNAMNFQHMIPQFRIRRNLAHIPNAQYLLK